MPRILVADDDPLLCELLRFRLEAEGFEILIAPDGQAALEAARLGPDLIVLDAMMPILSGPEVLRALKADPATAAIPVIMLTARRGETEIGEALRGGAAQYLTKPFMPGELAGRISRVMAERMEARDAA